MSTRRIYGRRWMRIRQAARDRNPLCVHCLALGIVRAWDELDHIVPLMAGGSNEPENLQGLCNAHHAAKTRRDSGFNDASCDETGRPLDPAHHWNQ